MFRSLRTRALATLSALLAAGVLSGCGDEAREDGTPAIAEAAEEAAGHVHGLGVNPRDDALFIATHSGLFRVAAGQSQARRVGDSRQDVMGFAVVGPDRFIGSGHPDPSTGGPANLGLIASERAGRAWTAVSLEGEADFHVLNAVESTIYGVDGMTLRVSGDAGRTWSARETPAPMFDAAAAPDDARHLIISTPRGLFTSSDGARSFRLLDARRAGLLARASRTDVSIVEGDGSVMQSTDGGRSWQPRGSIAGEPAAFVADGATLLAARTDGTVLASQDGGRSWTERVKL